MDDSQVYNQSGDVIDAATEGGGAIEIYPDSGGAEKRNEYLATYDGTMMASGSHTVVGTCVIRTSNLLTASQQNTLTENIIAVLTADDPASVKFVKPSVKAAEIAAETAVEPPIEAAPVMPAETREKTETTLTTDTENQTESQECKLYDQDGYVITCLGYKRSDGIFDADVITLQIQNLTNHNVMLNSSGSSVNDSMIEPIAFYMITSGKSQTEDVIIQNSDLQKAGINKVVSITFNFAVVDTDTYSDLAKIGPIEVIIDDDGHVKKGVLSKDNASVTEPQAEVQTDIETETLCKTQPETQIETQIETKEETQVETQTETQPKIQTESQQETQWET